MYIISYSKEYFTHSELILPGHLKAEDDMLLGDLTDVTECVWGPLYQGSRELRWKCYGL